MSNGILHWSLLLACFSATTDEELFRPPYVSSGFLAHSDNPTCIVDYSTSLFLSHHLMSLSLASRKLFLRFLSFSASAAFDAGFSSSISTSLIFLTSRYAPQTRYHFIHQRYRSIDNTRFKAESSRNFKCIDSQEVQLLIHMSVQVHPYRTPSMHFQRHPKVHFLSSV